MKHYRKKPIPAEKAYNPWESPTLPEDVKIGIYSRQSTLNQVKHAIQSQEMQTDDLVLLVQRMGVREENIILYLENRRDDGTMKSASGRLRIDQREGLSALVERIETDEIKAVVVFLEDRLFRDETQIEVNKFILICREHNCLVITPYMTYDFRNPYHVKQFRWKCEQAADYLREYVKERLLGAKLRASAQGKYDGRALPVGFIIDRREKVNGQPNPWHKKLIAYEPHAEIVRRIFKRYLELGGRTTQLYRELRREPVLFPEFDVTVDSRTVSRLVLQRVPGGYHISYKALQQLLTNVVYIGWWTTQDTIIKNNHTPIVEADLFWYAFHQLSDTTPEGEERDRPNRQVRYSREDKPEAPALLNGVIATNDPKKVVYCGYRFSDWYYLVKWREPLEAAYPELYSVLLEHVDQAFSAKLIEHMSNATEFVEFRTHAETIEKEAEKKRVDTTVQIARLEKRMQATLVSLTEDPDLPSVTRKALNQIYAELEQQRNDLLHVPEPQTQERQVTELLAYHKVIARLDTQWEKMDFTDRALLARATTTSITLDGLSPHFLLLTICWRTPLWGTDTAILWRPRGRAPFWTDEEEEIMGECYPTMPQEELMQRLPRRSWQSIKQKAMHMGVTRETALPQTIITINLSWQDTQVMQVYGLALSEVSSDNQIIWCRSAPTRAKPSWTA